MIIIILSVIAFNEKNHRHFFKGYDEKMDDKALYFAFIVYVVFNIVAFIYVKAVVLPRQRRSLKEYKTGL